MSADSPTRQIHVRLPRELHRRLRIRCAELDVTIQDYVVRALEQKLAVSTHPVSSQDLRRESSSE